MYRIVGISGKNIKILFNLKTQKIERFTTEEMIGKGIDVLPNYEEMYLDDFSKYKYYVLQALGSYYLIVDRDGKQHKVTEDVCRKYIKNISNMHIVGDRLEFMDTTRNSEKYLKIMGDEVVGYLDNIPEKIVIPSYVRKIGKKAFRESNIKYCKLTNVSIVEDKAFNNSKLEILDLSNSVVSIGKESFGGCKKLNFVKGVGNLSNIGERAFVGSPKLQYFPFNAINNQLEIEKEAFMGTQITEVNFNKDDNVVEVKERAFKDCNMITKIVCRGTINISDYAFFNCHGVESIEINNSEFINARAFSGLDRLRVKDIKLCQDLSSEAFN